MIPIILSFWLAIITIGFDMPIMGIMAGEREPETRRRLTGQPDPLKIPDGTDDCELKGIQTRSTTWVQYQAEEDQVHNREATKRLDEFLRDQFGTNVVGLILIQAQFKYSDL